MSSARNAGIRTAGGRYLMFLDADDLLHRDGVGWLVAAMDGREDGICQMGMRFFTDDPGGPRYDRVPGADAGFRPPQDDPSQPRFHALLPFLESHGRGSRRIRSLDGTLRRLGHVAPARPARSCFTPVPRIGAYYRCHPGSASSNQGMMFEATCRVYLKFLGELKKSADLLSRYGPDLFLATAERPTDRAGPEDEPGRARSIDRRNAQTGNARFRPTEVAPQASDRSDLRGTVGGGLPGADPIPASQRIPNLSTDELTSHCYLRWSESHQVIHIRRKASSTLAANCFPFIRADDLIRSLRPARSSERPITSTADRTAMSTYCPGVSAMKSNKPRFDRILTPPRPTAVRPFSVITGTPIQSESRVLVWPL